MVVSFVLAATLMSSEQEAIEKALEAGYKQSGMEKNVGEFVKDNIPQALKQVLEYAPAVDVVTNKRISFKWNF